MRMLYLRHRTRANMARKLVFRVGAFFEVNGEVVFIIRGGAAFALKNIERLYLLANHHNNWHLLNVNHFQEICQAGSKRICCDDKIRW